MSGSGFRVAGSGGLANIASILGASGITFRPVEDDSDDESSGDKIMANGDEEGGKGLVEGTDKLSAGSDGPKVCKE